MSLLHLPSLRARNASSNRRPRAFRPSLHPSLEGLEQRTVLSAPGSALVSAAVMHSPLSITGINVTKLAVTGANTLMASVDVNATLNTKLGSTPFTLHNQQIPITLTPGGTTADGCPILHLSLQIPDLNLLGLHVRLDNCNSGPVTVDVTAIHTGQPGGGVLGDLLCGVGNLLNGSGGLLNLGSQTGAVTGALSQVLNGLLTDLTTGSTAGTGGTMGTGGTRTDTIPAGDTSLVGLHLGPINANVLGLNVQTSPICLDVFADPHGGLLGRLLTQLDHLLNNPGRNGNAQQVLVGKILTAARSAGL